MIGGWSTVVAELLKISHLLTLFAGQLWRRSSQKACLSELVVFGTVELLLSGAHVGIKTAFLTRQMAHIKSLSLELMLLLLFF